MTEILIMFLNFKKNILLFKLNLFLLLFSYCPLTAQQIARASDVQLVLETGTFLNLSGGISFTGASNFKNNGTVNFIPAKINQNWLDSTATGVLDNSGTGLVQFNGDSIHQVYGLTRFYNLRVNTDSSVNLQSNTEVKNQLNLDKGLVTTNSYILLVSNPAVNAIQSTGSFGKRLIPDSFYAPVKIDKFNSNHASYTAEYFRTTPFDYLNFLNPPIDHISQVEYWEVQSSDFSAGADDDAKLSLSWRGGSVVSINPLTRDSLLIAQYTSFPRWEATGTITAIVNPVSGTGAFGYVKHFSFIGSFTNTEKQFTLGSRSPFNILPFRLLNWFAAPLQDKVKLQWDIAYEQDIKYYVIEKSLNGNSFSSLGSVNAGRLFSNSYLFYDHHPQPGFNYYQLKIADASGKISHAGIRKVWFGSGIQQISLYPNPAKNTIQLKFPFSTNQTNINIFDAMGQRVVVYKPAGSSLSINVAHLKPGTYFLNWVQDKQGHWYKFIKQ
jgi:hypothetical protein